MRGPGDSSATALPLAASGRSTLPTIDPSVLPSWPPLRSTRDDIVHLLLQKLVGPSPYSQHYGDVPEPEANLAAAAIEVEAFTAASESASGAALASHAERFEVHRTRT